MTHCPRSIFLKMIFSKKNYHQFCGKDKRGQFPTSDKEFRIFKKLSAFSKVYNFPGKLRHQDVLDSRLNLNNSQNIKKRKNEKLKLHPSDFDEN